MTDNTPDTEPVEYTVEEIVAAVTRGNSTSQDITDIVNQATGH